MFVTDKIVLQEVAYQITSGLTVMLVHANESPWPTITIYVGTYCVQIFREAKAKAKDMEHFKFSELSFHKYYVRGIIAKHCK